MTLLRWMVFLPSAFVGSVVAGSASAFMAELMGAPPWFQHIVSGALSGIAMILIGTFVAPRRTIAVKWTLIILLLVLGAMSAAGGFLGPDRMKSLIGLAMVLVGIGCFRVSPADLLPSAESTSVDPEMLSGGPEP